MTGKGIWLTTAVILSLLLVALSPTVMTAVPVPASADSVASSAPLAARFAALSFADLTAARAVPWSIVSERVARAAAAGARWLVLPAGLVTDPEPLPGSASERLAELAARHRLWLATSLPEAVADGKGSYDTAVLFSDQGRLVYRHRRVAARAVSDSRRGSPRAVIESIDVGDRRVGVINGDDLRIGIPRLADRGAETLLIPADWSAADSTSWLQLCRRLSREYSVDLVIANRRLLTADGAVRVFSRRGESFSLASGEVLSAALPASRPPWRIASGLGLPSVPVPTHQPVTPQLVELGRQLFADPGLSSTGEVSCASCHQADLAFANGEAHGHGVRGRLTARNVPSLLNVAFDAMLTWDGEISSLEAQAKYPISGAAEMDSHYLGAALDYVRGEPRYVVGLQRALGVETIEFEHVARALASFQRTLIAGGSPFDRYQYGGDRDALSASARRGLELFAGKAGCVSCHEMGERHALLTDLAFHNTGVGFDAAAGGFDDPGLGIVSAQEGLFFTPSLRNVAQTAPYMHDGSLATLRDVVEHYDRGGQPNPHLDPAIRPLGLDRREVRDLVAFLTSLTGADGGELVPRRGDDPPLVAALAPITRPAEVVANRGALEAEVAAAAGAGARIVVLPEHAQAGGALAATPIDAGSFVATLAARHGLWIAASFLVTGGDDAATQITQALYDDGGRLVHRQHKLAPRPQLGEGHVTAGNLRRLAAVDTPFGRLGIASGHDLDAALPRLAELGASTVLVPAAWRWSERVDWLDRGSRLAERLALQVVVSNLESATAPATSLRPIAGSVVRQSLARGVLLATLDAPRRGAVPLGLPPLQEPTFNPVEARKVALGRELFFDEGLSVSGTVSCATCHMPENFFADGKAVASGVADRQGQFNVPSIVNSAYRKFLFWEGNIRTLEDQVQHALHGWSEMNTRSDIALAYVRSQPAYRDAFRQITGRREIDFGDVERMIASFERSLLSGASPFDRFYYGGERSAMSQAAQRGLELFVGKAACSECHSIGDEAALFTDNSFHNTGVGYHPRFDYLGYKGNGLEGNVATGNVFRGDYHTPSLRNIALTAPYMHDGSLASLREVIDFYDRGGIANPFLDPLLTPLSLSEEEKSDLLSFLEALTGEPPLWQGTPSSFEPRLAVAHSSSQAQTESDTR